MEIFADTSGFNTRKKGKKHQKNKFFFKIVKNKKTCNTKLFLNMHINFPFGNIKRLSLLWKICLNMIL
jgi:hypothetical protein